MVCWQGLCAYPLSQLTLNGMKFEHVMFNPVDFWPPAKLGVVRCNFGAVLNGIAKEPTGNLVLIGT